MRNIQSVMILFVVCVLLGSCKNDNYDIEKTKNAKLVFDPMIGAPLLRSSNMTVEQTLVRYLGAEKVGVYSDKLVYLRYESINIPVDASNAISIPSPINILPSLSIASDDAGWTYSGGKSSITKDISYTFPFVNGEQIDSIAFNTLLYNITNLSSNIPVTGTTNTLTIEFHTLLKNGTPYTLVMPITNPMNGVTKTDPLTGYTLGLTGNQFNVIYTISLNGSLPLPGTSLTMVHNLGSLTSTLDYRYIKGYLGSRYIYKTTSSIPVALFDDAQGMVFEDPRVVVSVKNSFGIPMSISFTNLNATSSTGATIPISITGNGGQDSILSLNYLTDPNDTSVLTPQTFSNLNSNIKNALNSQPSQISYTISAKVNPAGAPTPADRLKHFIKSDSKADINMEIDFPLWGSCTKYGTNDVFGFDYAELFGNATGIEFKVWINNGLPAGGKLTMIFCDEDSVEIDRIADDLAIILPSPFDKTTGISTGVTEHSFTLKYYHLENLSRIKLCKVSTGFYSPYKNGTDVSSGVETVKIMSDNTMQMKIGMKVKLAYSIPIKL